MFGGARFYLTFSMTKFKLLLSLLLAFAVSSSAYAFSFGKVLSDVGAVASGSSNTTSAVSNILTQKDALVSSYADNLKSLATCYQTAAQALGYTEHTAKIGDLMATISSAGSDLSVLKNIPAKLKATFDISKVNLASLKPGSVDLNLVASVILQAKDIAKKDYNLVRQVKELAASAKNQLSGATVTDKVQLTQAATDLTSLGNLLGGDAQTALSLAQWCAEIK